MDEDYFANHPLTCRELTPEMLEKPEFQALQNLAYDGTPEEVCHNFKNHAYEALGKVIGKQCSNREHEVVECERAMHFFGEALESGWKEYQALFSLYIGRAKLNLLIN
jgi:hypothetical protein